jgi:hypothetical protein
MRNGRYNSFGECLSGDEGYRFVIHDRDRIYSQEFDQSLKQLGLTVLKTPYKCPQGRLPRDFRNSPTTRIQSYQPLTR